MSPEKKPDEETPKVEVLHAAPQIVTMTQLLRQIEDEIAAQKAGQLELAEHRVIAKQRDTQAKIVLGMIQAARLEKSIRNDLPRRIGPIDKPER